MAAFGILYDLLAILPSLHFSFLRIPPL